jgi:transposase
MSDALLAVGEDGVQPRRRRYSREFKRQVVEQSLQPGVSAAQVARAHELNGNLLHTWRWHYRSGLLGPVGHQGAALIPVALSTTSATERAPVTAKQCLSIQCGELVITLPSDIDPTTLKTVLAALRT